MMEGAPSLSLHVYRECHLVHVWVLHEQDAVGSNNQIELTAVRS